MGEQNSWEPSGCGTKKKHWPNNSLSRSSFSRFSAVISSPVGDNRSRNVRCVRKQEKEWYAIVMRRDPESILVVDRSPIRAWTTVRMMFPEIGPEQLAFRTLPEKECDAV
jgi:hypothetical protein